MLSSSAESISVYFTDTDEVPHKALFLNSFSKQQNSAIKVVTYRKMSVTKML